MELTLDQALQKGIEAHKAGKVQEADRYYTAILKANPKHPDANHNLGVLAVGVGKVEEALPFYKAALEANPTVEQFWLSYIDALIKIDRMTDAKAALSQAKQKGAKGNGFDQIERKLGSQLSKNSNTKGLPQEEFQNLNTLYNQGLYQETLNKVSQLQKQFPNSVILYNISGGAKKGLGKLDEAIVEYKKAIAHKSDYADTYNNVGVVLQEQGKLEEALEAYTKALSIRPDYAEAYFNKANILSSQDKLDEAIEEYAKALSLKPDYAEAYNNMGNLLREQGKLEEALEALSTALSIKPHSVEAQTNIGSTFKEQGKLQEAIEAFNKALAIKPDYATAWLNGAEALEKWNKLDELEIWLHRAFSLFNTVPADLLFMKCKLLWRYKKYEETSKLLEDIKFETISEVFKKDYLHLKAKHFEKSKKFDDAYALFIQSNSLQKRSKEYPKHNPEQYFQDLKDSLEKLRSSSSISRKTYSAENPEFSPSFIVGFPRSGTTLLDTILSSHTRIEVVEEQPIITAAESFLTKNGYNDFSGQLITPKLNLQAQKIYRKEFNKYLKTTLVDKVHIDKLPLNLLKASLIHQLYPNAKFILALRHPMDTILSCLMQNFKLNAAMANMVDLDRIVDFYCIAMEIFRACRTKYNLSVHEIRYEDLIDNFEKEAAAVVQFLNLKWEPKIESYQQTALKRGRINTPSYSQVVQPIYKDAKYRWLNYQKYLEQYLEQVKPWISEFGYD